MGRFAANTDTGSSATFTAGGTITQGDILFAKAGSPRAFPLPTSTASYQSNLNITPTAPMKLVNTESGCTSVTSCVLTSGDVVYAWAAATTAVKFAIYDANNNIVGSVVTVESGATGVNKVDVCALTGGGFAIAYCTVVNGVRSAVYSNAGTVTTSPFNVDVLATNLTDASIFVTGLLTGEYVIAYNNSAGYTCFNRFSALGVVQGGVTQIEAVSSLGNAGFIQSGISICTLTTGDFVVAYRNTATSVKFARYSPTAVLQGSITSMFTVNCNSVHVCQTSDGGFIVGFMQATYFQWSKYSSTGVISLRAGSVDTSIHGFGGNGATTALGSRVTSDPVTGGIIATRTLAAVTYIARISVDGQLTNNDYTFNTTTSYSVTAFAVVASGSSIFALFSNGTSPFTQRLTQANVDATSYGYPPFGSQVLTPVLATPAAAIRSTSSNSEHINSTTTPDGDVIVLCGNATNIFLTRWSANGVLKKHVMIESDNQNSLYAACTSMCKLSNGNLVVAIGVSGSRANVVYSIYTTDLVKVGTSFGSTMINISLQSVQIAALAGGGFVSTYNNTTTNVRCAIYSNTGTVVRAEYILLSGNFANNTRYNMAITPTSDGGFIFAGQNSTSGIMIQKFNAVGDVMYAINNATHATAAGNVFLAPTTDGGCFLYTTHNAATGFLYRYSHVLTVFRSTSFSINSNFGWLDYDPVSNTLIHFWHNSPGMTYARRDVSSLATIGFSPYSPFGNTPHFTTIGQDGVVNITVASGFLSQQNLITGLPVLGVAKSTATAGQAVTVSVSGTVATRQEYPYPAQFNDIGRGGVKGSLFGKTANMTTTVNSLG
jgi:hypothetical protein